MNSLKRIFAGLFLLAGLMNAQNPCSLSISNNASSGCAPLQVIFNCPSANSGTMTWTMENLNKLGFSVTHIFQNPGFYTITATLVAQSSPTSVTTCSALTTINVVTGPSNGCSNTVVVGLQQSFFGDEVRIYPNPNKGDFEIEFNQDLENPRIILCNAIGQQVHEQKLVKGSNTIRCNSLPGGVYVLKVYNNQTRMETRKLVVE